jgi:hypothetical protein
MTKKTISEIQKVIHDLGIDIETGDDALFVIGRLDALASVIAAHYFTKKRIKKAALLHEVLRRVAKEPSARDDAKSLRKAARKASSLLAIAEEVSYGELHEGGIQRAEALRAALYDLLYTWSVSLENED